MPVAIELLIALGVIALFILFMVVKVMTATSKAPPEAAEKISIDGKAQLLEGERYMEYRIGISIDASPDKIWALLTDAAGFSDWNSTVISIDGTIAEGQRIKLKAEVAPDRAFKLLVSDIVPNKSMMWSDGNRIFRGERTFTLTEKGGATEVTMAEVLTGAFLPQIAKKLPNFLPGFNAFAADLKKAAEA